MEQDAGAPLALGGLDPGRRRHLHQPLVAGDVPLPAADHPDGRIGALDARQRRHGDRDPAFDIPVEIAPVLQQRADRIDDDGVGVKLRRGVGHRWNSLILASAIASGRPQRLPAPFIPAQYHLSMD
jgi:hypothetical protein